MNPFTTCFKFKSDRQPTRKYQFFNSFQHLESILKDPTLGPATHDPYLDDKPIIKIYPAMMALSAKPETNKDYQDSSPPLQDGTATWRGCRLGD